METTTAFRGLQCVDCGAAFEPAGGEYQCPDCGGLLEAAYDYGAVTPSAFESRDVVGPTRYAEFLPFAPESLVSLDEGSTPAVRCPTLATDLDVDRVLVKDEGRNPTGGLVDRELSLAVTAARERGLETVALPTTGNGGQSAAAYAARAGFDSHSFVPTRCPFVNKAMVNVHGGEMTVVEGRYEDALEAYEKAQKDVDDGDGGKWLPVGPASAYRREGAKTIYFELAESLDWSPPDAIVVPTGHGIALAGIHAAIEDLEAAGLVDDRPRLYAGQPSGCSPIVNAWKGGTDVEGVERSDTIVGPLEIADPVVGDLAVEAVTATDGDAVVVGDDAILEGGADAASETGVEVGATGGVAVAGARKLAADGAFDADETVVLVNPVAGSKESDLLRSYLMSQGM